MGDAEKHNHILSVIEKYFLDIYNRIYCQKN